MWVGVGASFSPNVLAAIEELHDAAPPAGGAVWGTEAAVCEQLRSTQIYIT